MRWGVITCVGRRMSTQRPTHAMTLCAVDKESMMGGYGKLLCHPLTATRAYIWRVECGKKPVCNRHKRRHCQNAWPETLVWGPGSQAARRTWNYSSAGGSPSCNFKCIAWDYWAERACPCWHCFLSRPPRRKWNWGGWSRAVSCLSTNSYLLLLL